MFRVIDAHHPSVMFLLILLCSLPKYEAARILAVIPTPSLSHQVPFRPLTQELVKRGHEVVIMTTDPAFPKGGSPENLTEIDVHDISYKIWRENIHKIDKGKTYDPSDQLQVFFDMAMEVFETQMNTEQMQQIIQRKTEPFDLILAEACYLATLGFSHIYKVPVIQMSSFLPLVIDLPHIGVPDHPILFPTMVNQKLDNLSVLEKIKVFYEHYFSLQSEFHRQEAYIDRLLKKIFDSDIPPVTELYNNINMYFVNAFPIWDSNRPVPPSVQYLGGIHLKPAKELPQDLKSYLDSSKYGVIYISFGTNVSPSSLPPERIQTFINVLSRLHFDVLWKWDKDELPGRSKNIKISKWLPQSDLLRHPKIKLFITQGGLQSTDEAIFAGVPLLGIPMFGDQWYNVAMYERHKIGVKLEMEGLNEEKFEEVINSLTKDDTYRQNIIKFRCVIYDQPQTPLERAVWWTEHVLRHGGARHLRSPAANLPWTQYYEVELVTGLLLAVISVIALLLFLVFIVRKLIICSVRGNIKLKHS